MDDGDEKVRVIMWIKLECLFRTTWIFIFFKWMY